MSAREANVIKDNGVIISHHASFEVALQPQHGDDTRCD
jgi:hypothetical protein